MLIFRFASWNDESWTSGEKFQFRYARLHRILLREKHRSGDPVDPRPGVLPVGRRPFNQRFGDSVETIFVSQHVAIWRIRYEKTKIFARGWDGGRKGKGRSGGGVGVRPSGSFLIPPSPEAISPEKILKNLSKNSLLRQKFWNFFALRAIFGLKSIFPLYHAHVLGFCLNVKFRSILPVIPPPPLSPYVKYWILFSASSALYAAFGVLRTDGIAGGAEARRDRFGRISGAKVKK